MRDAPAEAAAKRLLRHTLLRQRRALTSDELRTRAEAMAERLLATTEVRRAGTLACYLSVGAEPGTGPLIESLRAAGKSVIVPILAEDDDLDWAEFTGPGATVEAGRGLREPSGDRLGADAVARADLVLIPGLAADRAGHRLGRGGGSYDRALARVPDTVPVWVLLYDAEVLDHVPTEEHDRPVDAAVTATRTVFAAGIRTSPAPGSATDRSPV